MWGLIGVFPVCCDGGCSEWVPCCIQNVRGRICDGRKMRKEGAGQKTGQGGEPGLTLPAPSTTSPLAVTSSGDGR